MSQDSLLEQRERERLVNKLALRTGVNKDLLLKFFEINRTNRVLTAYISRKLMLFDMYEQSLCVYDKSWKWIGEYATWLAQYMGTVGEVGKGVRAEFMEGLGRLAGISKDGKGSIIEGL